jgi:hypothetical protein
VTDDIAEEIEALVDVAREHAEADAQPIVASASSKSAAEKIDLLRDLRRCARGRTFAHQVGGEARNPGFSALAGELSESVKESISDRNQRTFHRRDAEFAEFGKVNDNFFLGVRRASAMVFS